MNRNYSRSGALSPWPSLVAILALMCSATSLHAAEENTEGVTPNSWHVAASNREATAAAQEAASGQLMEQASVLRVREYLYDSERRANFENAGDAEMRAGDLLVAAASSYEAAAVNWEQAASEYTEAGQKESADDATKQAAAAVVGAEAAKMAAGRCYMLAAEAFSDDNANNADKAKAVAERLGSVSAAGKSE